MIRLTRNISFLISIVMLTLFSLIACQAGKKPAAQRDWQPVGGAATVPLDVQRPFLQFAPNLSTRELQGVSQGRELFVASWFPAPSQPVLDGLGPLFIADACVVCHSSAGRLNPFKADGSLTPALLFRIGNERGEAHPVYGRQLQSRATTGEAEGTVSWHYAATTANKIKREFTLTLSNPEIPLADFFLSPRLSPQLLGMGLLDAVPVEQILAYADPDDADADGISGRPHWRDVAGEKKLGRFGWKAAAVSLEMQSAEAFHQDMGLTSSLFPEENCTASQMICSQQPSGGTPEVSDSSLQAIVSFLSVLAVPERRINHLDTFNKGADIFEEIGCAACHRPTFTTGEAPFAALSQQKIYAYTDLLLHDMGEGLSARAGEGAASPTEWRTPPLWGLALGEARVYLHDGRASSLEEAILWHGGEAAKARAQFHALSAEDTRVLLEFLAGL